MRTRRWPTWQWVLGIGTVILAVSFLGREVRQLATTRGAVQTFARLIAGVNQGDLATVRSLYSPRYLATHPPELARAGGMIGLPRSIHPNFRVWVQGGEVWLCAANRVGTVYRFVREANQWLYNGPAGFLQSDGTVVPTSPEQGQPD